MSDAFLRLSAVQARVGLSKSSVWRYVKAGVFPKPISIGRRTTVWVEREVADWQAAQIEKSRGLR